MRTVALSEVAQINPRWSPAVKPDDAVSFVGMANLSDEQGRVVAEEQRRVEEVRKGYTPFLANDLLVAKITPCFENGKIGRATISETYGAGSTEFHVVRPGAELDGRYALHFLRRPHFRAAGELRMTGSGGQRRVPADYVAGTKIPLPSMDEQHRIADILDKADILRAKRREAIGHLDTLSQSIFHEMFGSPHAPFSPHSSVPLSEYARLKSGGTPSRDNKIYWDGDIPWFSPKDIKRDILTDSIEHISQAALDETSLDLVPARSVIFVVRGMILAHTFPVAITAVPGAINQDIKSVVQLPTKEFVPEFLAANLNGQSRRVIENAETSAHGTKRLGPQSMRDILIIDAPLVLQQEYANRVSAVERLKTQHRAQLAELDNLFLSLQNRAFKGHL